MRMSAAADGRILRVAPGAVRRLQLPYRTASGRDMTSSRWGDLRKKCQIRSLTARDGCSGLSVGETLSELMPSIGAQAMPGCTRRCLSVAEETTRYVDLC